MKKKVLLGMSGGVDSSVSACLLLDQGYEVLGVTLKLLPDGIDSDCGSNKGIEDAKNVADQLKIKHLTIEFKDIFKKKVIDYFLQEYLTGKTPNPCVECNKHLKFGAMFDFAMSKNFDYISTGHYAKIEYSEKLNRWLLKKASSSKDQSYVLYTLGQNQLAHILFPLSNFEKSYTRKLAENFGLKTAQKPDSQDICFISDGDHHNFIERYSGITEEKGNFLNQEGNVLGEHKGISKYTIGQRKGLGITSLGYPAYVTKIDHLNNTITLGGEGSQYFKSLIADKLNFILFDSLDKEIEVLAKIRYQSPLQKAKIFPIDKDKIRVVFEEKQRSITPGQSIVFYNEDIVLGGGVILNSEI